MNEKRLDVVVTERKELGVESRTKAHELIKQKKISVNGRIVEKPSETVSENAEITVEGGLPKYVGRGGYKLETAAEIFSIDLKDCVCLDVGASTGGFTDFMIQNGAKKIYAVDVGKEQLHKKLKNDERVISLENLDIRNAGEREIPEKVDFITADVSFISLKLIIPEFKRFFNGRGKAAVLIKPQFEAGKKRFKNGVLKDVKEHEAIISDIKSFIAAQGYYIIGVTESKITGGEGNREYIICFSERSI